MSELAESETKRNVALLEHAYALWNDSKADSAEHWMDMIDDKVNWRSIADGAKGMEFTRVCCGKDEVAQYFQDLGGEWEMKHYTVDEFIAQGDRVVMLGSCGWTNRKTGQYVDTPKADFITMKDGKITDFYEMYDTMKTLEASRA